ncbi:unnamed protein product [Rotaria sp. Silwood1]|nr:unnamed protein product [Rotaria sp. Silwood1]CAF0784224.1 unnamed protein product [Rotaria sp. Silwood1]CAF3338601.1 unnamed protein product [Rotaria sp. Silwood1]CAF4589043.1 unnamed protein product [Rotaria sp. Silwood1]CAF4702945.1 unnamed protein product [Rotaria sp. Silwood1]
MTETQKKDWKGYTLVMPSICHCHVGQLAVDILINTLHMKSVHSLDWTCVEPVIAYDPYENTNRENLAFGIEVYEEQNLKILVIQQRGNIVSGKRQEFVDKLLAFFKNEQLKEIIVLTAFNAVERNDVQLTGEQFRYLSTTEINSNDLNWIALEERQDKNHHKIVRDRDRYYIAGGGIANRLFYTAQQAQIPITVLLMFTDIGQEVKHANELLVRLNQWKKLCQVEQWQIPASQRAWIETQTVPPIY